MGFFGHTLSDKNVLEHAGRWKAPMFLNTVGALVCPQNAHDAHTETNAQKWHPYPFWALGVSVVCFGNLGFSSKQR